MTLAGGVHLFLQTLALSELSKRNREAFCLPVDAGCCYGESVERTRLRPGRRVYASSH